MPVIQQEASPKLDSLNEPASPPAVETPPATETDTKLEEPDENKLTRGQRQVNNALKHLEREKGHDFYGLRKEARRKQVEDRVKIEDSDATVSLALLGQVEPLRPLKRRLQGARREHLNKSKSRSDP
jgi:hypothetical protein